MNFVGFLPCRYNWRTAEFMPYVSRARVQHHRAKICVLLTTLYSLVCSQATGPAQDTNSLFTNLLATSNSPGQMQMPTDPNTPSFGNPSLGASAGFGAAMGQNMGFLGGQPGMPGRGMSSGFPMSSMGGMSSNSAPAPLPRPSMAQNMMPFMMLSGSDMAQRMALMSMMGGGGAASPMGGGGMMGNPLFMYSLMNM